MLKSFNKPSTEQEEQRKVIQYLNWQYSSVRYHVSLDGEIIEDGKRRKIAATQSQSGFPDLLIFYCQMIDGVGYCGLVIEMKKKNAGEWYEKDGVVYNASGTEKKNKHLQQQAQWLNYLRSQGWVAAFCKGFDEAKELIDNYMKQK